MTLRKLTMSCGMVVSAGVIAWSVFHSARLAIAAMILVGVVTTTDRANH